MFAASPFAEISESIPPAVMQAYVAAMALLVMAGTVYDTLHKKSAQYFFRNWRDAGRKGSRRVGAGEMISLAARAVLVDGMMSGEFCNRRRRAAHLLTMYGFLAFVASTAILVFLYPTPATPPPAILPRLWYLGALLVCVGGYWFWFFIRVDVAAEGHSPFRVVFADLFILSLLASATAALAWGCLQSAGSAWASPFFALHIIASTVLFGSVPWSKFAHMFYKPAAALQRRVEEANGSRSNLPPPADRPETFGSARRCARHY